MVLPIQNSEINLYWSDLKGFEDTYWQLEEAIISDVWVALVLKFGDSDLILYILNTKGKANWSRSPNVVA